MKISYILGIILTCIQPSSPMATPGKEWYELAYQYIEGVEKQIDEPPLNPTIKSTHVQETVIEKVFTNDIDLRSLLEYAMKEKTSMKQKHRYRNVANSFGIEKTRNIYKVYGKIPLKEVFSSLLHFCHWDIDPSVISELRLNIGGTETSFAIKQTEDCQIQIYSTTTWTMISFDDFMPVLERTDSVSLATFMLDALNSSIDNQPTFVFEDSEFLLACVHFLTITYIADSAIPKEDGLEAFIEAFHIRNRYKTQIQNADSGTDKLRIILKRNNEIDFLMRNMDKSGGVPFIDRFVEEILIQIRAGKNKVSFKNAFNEDNYPARHKDATKGTRKLIFTEESLQMLSSNWYKNAEDYIKRALADLRTTTKLTTELDLNVVNESMPRKEYIFKKDIKLKSILKYASKVIEKVPLLLFRTEDNAIQMRKMGPSDYAIDGKIDLKTVFSSLQYYRHFRIDYRIRTRFACDFDGGISVFYLQIKDTHGQSIVYSSDIKCPEYDIFMSIIEEVPDFWNLADKILKILDTPLNKQSHNLYLGSNDTIRKAVIDFLAVTHIAETTTPSPKELHSLKNKIDIVRNYKKDIRNESDKGKSSKLELSKNEEIKSIMNVLEKHGRIPLMDKFVRKHLRDIKENITDFRKVFAHELYIFSKTGSTHLGQIDNLIKYAEEGLGDDKRSIPDLLKSEKQQQIATIKASKDEQTALLQKRIADEIRNVESKRNKLCNNRRRKLNICGVHFGNEHLKIDIDSIQVHDDKIKFIILDTTDGSFYHTSEIKIKQDELVYHNFIKYLMERGQSKNSRKSSLKVNKILGMYGIIEGICASKNKFDNGDEIRGSFFISQTTYTTRNLVDPLRAADTFFDKIGSKVLNKIANKFDLEKDVQRLVDKIVLSSSASPVVGLSFDANFIEEDIRDFVNVDLKDTDHLPKVPLQVTPLQKDFVSTIYNLARSQIEPTVLALSIFRMKLNNQYKDIFKEFKALHWDSPWTNAEELGAFVLGNAKNMSDIFTGGLISEMENLRSQVSSNNGKGKANINNFAYNTDTDIFIFNVSFSKLTCIRIKRDLWIGQGSEDRVKVENYFKWSTSDHYKHLIFRSADGVIFYPLSTKDNNVTCIATALEYSYSKAEKDIDLKLDIFRHVVSVVGTPFADKIYGNSYNNILDTGGGNDFLSGGNGSDTYLVRKKSYGITDKITIDNKAGDNTNDLLIIQMDFNQITPLKSGNDLKFSCGSAFNILLKSWFIDDSSGHISFISGDHVMFNVKMREEILKKIPTTIDLSKLTHGVQLDMQNRNINVMGIPKDILPRVHTVSDSSYSDNISGNSLDNFLTCSGGRDVLKGNAGMDIYVISENCSYVEIDNYDESEVEDMLFLLINCRTKYEQSKNRHSLIITCKKTQILLLNWFKDAKYRHLKMHVKHFVTALPEDPTELATLNLVEINKYKFSENTIIDMEKDKFYKKSRGTFMYFISNKSAYIISGNELNNFIRIGIESRSRDPHYMEGRNGTDTYEVHYDDGKILINNSASDSLTDHLKLGVFYDDLAIIQKPDNTVLKSKKVSNHLTVELQHYCKSVQYQHLQIHTIDGVILKLVGTCDEMNIHVLQMDMSRADSSQYLSLRNSLETNETLTVYGSLKYNNVIEGNDKTNKLVGGIEKDEINGHNGNDWIEGKAGNDILKGGNGNDIIFGGEGDDLIYGNDADDVIYPGSGTNTADGGHGIDTVVLNGDNIDKRGVTINLQEGFGRGFDSANNLLISIENAIGSEFNDTLVGSDTDNLLRGYGGEDTLIPLEGSDYLFGGEGKDTIELTNATGLKIIDNYAKDQSDDIFVVQSSFEHNVCSFRYNKNLHLSFLHGTNTSKHLDMVFHDWYEGDIYQHANFKLKDTVIHGNTYSDLDNEEQTSNMLDDVTLSSSYKNGHLFVSWGIAVQKLKSKWSGRVILAYREMTKQKYTIVNVDNTTNFVIDYLSNYEVRLLYVKCEKILGFTEPHHAFSFIDISVYFECFEKPLECYIGKHFKLWTVPLRKGWLLDWITDT